MTDDSAASRAATTTRPRAGSPATTTPACTPRCSRRSSAPTAATSAATAPTPTRLPLPRYCAATSATQAEVFFVFNGTGANVISLQAMTERWDAVICADSAHINVDECGAPEKIAGLKLLTVATPDGKLTPALIDVHAHGFR